MAKKKLQRLSEPLTDNPPNGDSKILVTIEQVNKLVAQIAESLVDHPEDVTVKSISGAHTVVMELKVSKEDVGQVIGRQGRTANALRIIVSAVSAKIKKRTVLEIIE